MRRSLNILLRLHGHQQFNIIKTIVLFIWRYGEVIKCRMCVYNCHPMLMNYDEFSVYLEIEKLADLELKEKSC